MIRSAASSTFSDETRFTEAILKNSKFVAVLFHDKIACNFILTRERRLQNELFTFAVPEQNSVAHGLSITHTDV